MPKPCLFLFFLPFFLIAATRLLKRPPGGVALSLEIRKTPLTQATCFCDRAFFLFFTAGQHQSPGLNMSKSLFVSRCRAASSVFGQGSRGFTLVELMVVVAIIGILMIVALPAYNNYSTKSKFAEVVLATAPTKTAIATCVGTGDCLSGNAIALVGASGSGSGGALFVPSAANDPPASPNALAVMTAAMAAFNVAYNQNLTTTQINSQAATLVSLGYWVTTQPGVPTNVCFMRGAETTCESNQVMPISSFNSFYAPNAAIIAAGATNTGAPANLPCVGGAGCSPATKYAASVSYDSTGVITATAQTTSGLNAETFVLVPSYSSGRVDWAASGTCKTRAGGALC